MVGLCAIEVIDRRGVCFARTSRPPGGTNGRHAKEKKTRTEAFALDTHEEIKVAHVATARLEQPLLTHSGHALNGNTIRVTKCEF